MQHSEVHRRVTLRLEERTFPTDGKSSSHQWEKGFPPVGNLNTTVVSMHGACSQVACDAADIALAFNLAIDQFQVIHTSVDHAEGSLFCVLAVFFYDDYAFRTNVL